MSLSTRSIAAFAAAALMSVAPIAAAQADPPAPADPCAQQSAQLAKAEAALTRVTAVFERQQAHVSHARDALAAAMTHVQKDKARAALEHALANKDKVKKAKKAQLKRVEKAQARLDACNAGAAA